MADLKNLEVGEVSLVDKAANKREFLVLKHFNGGNSMSNELIVTVDDDGLAALLKKAASNEDGMGDLLTAIATGSNSDILKALASGGTTGSEELKKAGLSEKAIKAVQAAVKALSVAKGELPDDIMKTLAKLSGYQYPEEEPAKKKKAGDTEYETETETEKKATKKSSVFKADGTPDLDAIPDPGTRAMLEALWKSSQDQVAALKKSEDQRDTLKKELDEERQNLFKERSERSTKEFVAKAAEYKNLGAKPEDLGALLKKCSEALSPDEFKALDTVLKSANEGMSSVFKETGFSGDSGGDTSAYSQLVRKAHEISSRDKISKEQAFVKAMDENPDLAKRERDERNR